MRTEERAMLAMSAYDALKANFDAFCNTWEETAKATPGARIAMSTKTRRIMLFDGQEVALFFSMIFDADGTAWGRVSFTCCDQPPGEAAIWNLYYDSLGSLAGKPGGRDATFPYTVSNQYRFAELLYMLVDRYLSLPRFKE